jgi:hypothetical protein
MLFATFFEAEKQLTYLWIIPGTNNTPEPNFINFFMSVIYNLSEQYLKQKMSLNFIKRFAQTFLSMSHT